jgi:hypothetical protein
MQHDTSPHRLMLAGKPITAQCAALVLAFSRRLFVQYYPRYVAPEFMLSCRPGSSAEVMRRTFSAT